MPEKTANDLKGKTGLTRLINATRYSYDGIRAALKSEEAFREELLLALVLIPVSFFLPVELSLRLLCLFSVFFVLIVELLNSGIEAAIDRIGPEIHPKSKFAKDLGSAAVLFSLILCALTWGSVLFTVFFP